MLQRRLSVLVSTLFSHLLVFQGFLTACRSASVRLSRPNHYDEQSRPVPSSHRTIAAQPPVTCLCPTFQVGTETFWRPENDCGDTNAHLQPPRRHLRRQRSRHLQLPSRPRPRPLCAATCPVCPLYRDTTLAPVRLPASPPCSSRNHCACCSAPPSPDPAHDGQWPFEPPATSPLRLMRRCCERHSIALRAPSKSSSAGPSEHARTADGPIRLPRVPVSTFFPPQIAQVTPATRS